MNQTALLIWDSQSVFGLILILGFGALYFYMGVYRINENEIRNTMIKVGGREPFNNAAKLMNYGIKISAVAVGLGAMLLVILALLSH